MPESFLSANSRWKICEKSDTLLSFEIDSEHNLKFQSFSKSVEIRYNSGVGFNGISSNPIDDYRVVDCNEEIAVFVLPNKKFHVGICLFDGILATVWKSRAEKNWKRINFAISPSDPIQLFSQYAERIIGNSFEIVDSVSDMLHRFSVFRDQVAEINGSIASINYIDNSTKLVINNPLKLYI